MSYELIKRQKQEILCTTIIFSGKIFTRIKNRIKSIYWEIWNQNIFITFYENFERNFFGVNMTNWNNVGINTVNRLTKPGQYNSINLWEYIKKNSVLGLYQPICMPKNARETYFPISFRIHCIYNNFPLNCIFYEFTFYYYYM